MKKLIFLYGLLLLYSVVALSQDFNFTDVTAQIGLPNVEGHSHFFDYDADGDLDIIVFDKIKNSGFIYQNTNGSYRISNHNLPYSKNLFFINFNQDSLTDVILNNEIHYNYSTHFDKSLIKLEGKIDKIIDFNRDGFDDYVTIKDGKKILFLCRAR